MFALISFTILLSYTAYYLLRVGLLPSHSDSYLELRKQGWMFQVSLFLTAFLLMIPLLDVTPNPFKFTAFFTCAPVLFTAFAPDFRKENGKVTMERKVHMLGAKIGGVLSFIWVIWMTYCFGWQVMAVTAALAVVYYLLNRKFDKPVLFLEYWVFTYPYAILLILKFM